MKVLGLVCHERTPFLFWEAGESNSSSQGQGLLDHVDVPAGVGQEPQATGLLQCCFLPPIVPNPDKFASPVAIYPRFTVNLGRKPDSHPRGGKQGEQFLSSQ